MEATTEQLNNETHSQRYHQAKLDHSMETEGWRRINRRWAEAMEKRGGVGRSNGDRGEGWVEAMGKEGRGGQNQWGQRGGIHKCLHCIVAQ